MLAATVNHARLFGHALLRSASDTDDKDFGCASVKHRPDPEPPKCTSIKGLMVSIGWCLGYLKGYLVGAG